MFKLAISIAWRLHKAVKLTCFEYLRPLLRFMLVQRLLRLAEGDVDLVDLLLDACQL